MAKVHAILSSRRSYEFPIDALRLTLLAQTGVLNHLKDIFGFQLAEVAQPPESFGPVAATLPAGLVFATGIAPFPEGSGTPIRTIFIDSRRIVIDLAGPTSEIEPTFNSLRLQLASLTAADGAPAIGGHRATLDYSEISFSGSTLAHRIVRPEVSALLDRYFKESRLATIEDHGLTLQPTATFAASVRDSEYPGGSSRETARFVLEPRAGSRPEEAKVFSAAPLDSDSHVEMFLELDRLLSPTLEG